MLLRLDQALRQLVDFLLLILHAILESKLVFRKNIVFKLFVLFVFVYFPGLTLQSQGFVLKPFYLFCQLHNFLVLLSLLNSLVQQMS